MGLCRVVCVRGEGRKQSPHTAAPITWSLPLSPPPRLLGTQ